MSFPSFINLQISHKSPFLFMSLFPTSPIFLPSHPTSLLLCLPAIPWPSPQSPMFLDLNLQSYTHLLCINLLPPASSCYHKLQPLLLETASLCSFREQSKKVIILSKDNISFSSQRMKGHCNPFNSTLEKVASELATELRLLFLNPQHVCLELRRRNLGKSPRINSEL